MIQEDPAERATLPEIIRRADAILCSIDPNHDAHPGDKMIKAVKKAIEVWDMEEDVPYQEDFS